MPIMSLTLSTQSDIFSGFVSGEDEAVINERERVAFESRNVTVTYGSPGSKRW